MVRLTKFWQLLVVLIVLSCYLIWVFRVVAHPFFAEPAGAMEDSVNQKVLPLFFIKVAIEFFDEFLEEDP